MLRVEKVNSNVDDFRVFLAGFTILGLMLVLQGPAMLLFDKYFAERPFLTAFIELRAAENGDVIVTYDADATQPIDGVWIATVHAGDGARLDSRRGTGKYSAKIDSPREWSWVAFFSAEDGVPPPAIPTGDFYVCVRYEATARDSGFTHDTGEYCSNVISEPKVSG